MNQMILAASTPTMTSREIADLTGKRHDNVMRVCRDLKASGIIPQIEECRVINELANGREFTEFRLNKRDSLVLVARLSPEFTARLVDRWQELEAQLAQPPQLSTMDILQIAMNSERERLRLEAELEIAAPKAEFVDRYVEATSGSKGFREVCKLLKIKEPEFRLFLEDAKIMYRLGGAWTAYQNHIDAGRFEVKTGMANEHAYSQVKFTAKGIQWVAGEWAKASIRIREDVSKNACISS